MKHERSKTDPSNQNATIAKGIADHLREVRNTASRSMITQHTGVKELEVCIENYLDGLTDIQNLYDKETMIRDLILLLKGGNAGVAKHLIDMLGFENTDETFTINFINYGDIKEGEDIKEEE